MRRMLWVGIVIGIVLFARSQHVSAAEEFVSLFDGKTLTGWKVNELPEEWKVVDGAIVVNGKPSHLFYVGSDPDHPAEFKNFHLRLDVMTHPKSNSGVYFHTKFQPTGWPSVGYECQVNQTHTDPVKTASIYSVVKNYEAPAKDNEWFKLEIIVKGKNIQTKVNGKIIADYTEPDGELAGTRKLSQGTFALQGHDPGSTVQFKNIEVQKLP